MSAYKKLKGRLPSLGCEDVAVAAQLLSEFKKQADNKKNKSSPPVPTEVSFVSVAVSDTNTVETKAEDSLLLGQKLQGDASTCSDLEQEDTSSISGSDTKRKEPERYNKSRDAIRRVDAEFLELWESLLRERPPPNAKPLKSLAWMDKVVTMSERFYQKQQQIQRRERRDKRRWLRLLKTRPCKFAKDANIDAATSEWIQQVAELSGKFQQKQQQRTRCC